MPLFESFSKMVVNTLVSKANTASPALQNFRLRKCLQCPFLGTAIDSTQYCTQCTCPVRGKVMVASDSCPDKRW